MTDNEIIKALECCANNGDCKECAINPHKGNYGYCTSLAIKAALDLINRQKAEIERSCVELDEVIIAKDLLFDEAEALIKKAKAEAIKEFAERLKELNKTKLILWHEDIDNLVKEMVGEENE